MPSSVIAVMMIPHAICLHPLRMFDRCMSRREPVARALEFPLQVMLQHPRYTTSALAYSDQNLALRSDSRVLAERLPAGIVDTPRGRYFVRRTQTHEGRWRPTEG